MCLSYSYLLEKIAGSVISLHFLLQRPFPFKGCCFSVGEEGSLDQALDSEV